MFVAAIDPGVTTGVVAAFVKPRVDIVTIQLHLVQDISDPSTVSLTVAGLRCHNIFVEQKPSRPSKEGLDSWEIIVNSFVCDYKYRTVTSGRLGDYKERTMFLVQPSHWKPFMKARRSLLPKGLPHHAKDALLMLHYAIQINYPDKEIIYA
jgi:hypothetical protein